VGLSVSASFAIITVAFFIGAAYLVETVFISMDVLMEGAEDLADVKMDWARTHLTFNNATLNNSKVIVNLTNSGSTVLSVSGVSVLVNGSYVHHNLTNATVEGKSSNIWSPAEKLRLELDISASTSERVMVVLGNGARQYGVIS
jgi:archaellum component FlaF (FlaF/FlaG flagellin family)